MKKIISILFALLVSVNFANAEETGQAKLNVVTTTGMIGDLVHNIGGDSVTTTSLMGTGVDPHLYKATQGDLGKLMKADVVFYNGLHLEGKMADILKKLSSRKPVYAVTDNIPDELLRKPPEFEGQFDPHIWFDVALWKRGAEFVRDQLIAQLPQKKEEITNNAKVYLDKLTALDTWTKSEIQLIPQQQRVLITAHDAFGYFGDRYEVDVLGLQGISTASEYGLNDIERLSQVIIKRKVKAVFVESSVPQKFILSLQQGVQARGHQVKIGETLFSDAMGAANTPEGNYIGMVTANVNTIVGALK
jgi:manganese/zinc/iron transport system substrate-binding protein